MILWSLGVGLAWLGSLGLLLRRLMQEKIDKSVLLFLYTKL